MNELGLLLCGRLRTPGIAASALTQLSESINNFSERAVNFFNAESSVDILSLGPFCSRVVLENGCAALVGRLDAFRLSYLSEFQSQPQYEVGKRAKSAFSWTGDVIPDAENQEMWGVNHDMPKISRALFSKYADHFFWKPAIDRMLDFLATRPPNERSPDLMDIDPDNYISTVKGRGSQLYSSLSKGVHWEYFTSALVLDDPTIKTLIRDTCVLVAQLGLISHFIPTACASLSPAKALSTYRAFRRALP